MVPIVCVGETLEQREQGATESVIVPQVQRALVGVSAEQIAKLAIAYEPVWAIGTGRNANPDDAGAVCDLIRNTVTALTDREAAAGLRVLYGGSVNAGNINGFMAKRSIDGALVGGASLDPDTFAAVVRYWA